MINKNTFLNIVIEEFTKNADINNAIAMEQYMRNKFVFFGIKAPERKQIQRTIIKKTGFPNIIDLEYITISLWNNKYRELQYFAMELLQEYLLELNINLLEKIITTKSWWDTIDSIASKLVGILFINNINLRDKYIEKWLISNNIWLKRTSIIFQLKYKDKTDFELLKRIIIQLKYEDNFFIKKAIGWALREYSKSYPNKVIQLVNTIDLKPLSKKEGLKYINKNN